MTSGAPPRNIFELKERIMNVCIGNWNVETCSTVNGKLIVAIQKIKVSQFDAVEGRGELR